MSTRSRILLALLVLTLGPLLGVGAWACAHAVRWSEDVVVARLARGAIDGAVKARDAHAEAVRRLEDLGATLSPEMDDAALAAAAAAWTGDDLALVSIVDADGRSRLDAASAVPGCGIHDVVPVSIDAGAFRLTAALPVRSVLPPAATREPRRVLLDAGGEPIGDPDCAGRTGLLPDDAATRRTAGSWSVPVPSTDWTVIGLPGATWPAPYGNRTVLVIFAAMFLAVAAAGAFVILVRDLWRSLDLLRSAADRIGGGDFSPWLPPPAHDEVGRLSFAIGTMAARLEQVMQQNVRNRQMVAIGELASHISHEIRNPLSSLKLNLQSIDRELRAGSVPTDLPDVVGLCLGEIHRLDGTVQGVLRLAGSRDMHAAPCDLRNVVEEALQTVRPQFEARGIDLDTDLRPASIEADAAQLRGVVLNLLLNAHDALPRGGRIVVRTGAEDAVARLVVSDDGPGVPAAQRDRIFQPFYTTKPTGTGIGLPLSARIVEAHGGALRLESRDRSADATKGSGATFVVELPLRHRPAPPVRRWHRPRVGRPDETIAEPVESG